MIIRKDDDDDDERPEPWLTLDMVLSPFIQTLSKSWNYKYKNDTADDDDADDGNDAADDGDVALVDDWRVDHDGVGVFDAAGTNTIKLSRCNSTLP